MKLQLAILFFTISQILLGQGVGRMIEGRVLDKATQTAVPYANIYNKTLQKGTISNDDGYFRIEAAGVKDAIFVTFIGYKEQGVALRHDVSFYTILLEESTQLLSEVVVTPKRNTYLYELIAGCKKQPSDKRKSAKAYYELKSYRDGAQVELVESYYNLDISGYELLGMKLKAGRLAMQPHGSRYFASLESSTAIATLRLMGKNQRYPNSPLQLSKKAMMKSYYLDMDKQYLSDEGDSIYVIDFEPSDKSGPFYAGKIWINKNRHHVLKINLTCEHCQRHPFLPMFPTDSIANVSFDITKTFEEIDGQMAFNHIDFTYVVSYKSRIGKENESAYSIKTNALLYAYDFDHSFRIPTFDFKDISATDYREIGAMPYNDFFWQNNDEYRLNDRKNTNERFFNNPNSVNNKALFKASSQLKRGFFEHPYVQWSNNRIIFREIVEDTTKTAASGGFNAEKYHLAAKLFVDINTYGDSTHVQTATIFDPYESYYYLPMDNKALCFINLFFDVCEIERRELERELRRNGKDPAQMQVLHDAFIQHFETRKKDYLKSVERGSNEAAVLKWNKHVLEQLGINNVEIFDPFGYKKKS